MKDSNTPPDTSVLLHYTVSQNLFWGVSSKVVSLLSPHALILTKIYISSQINLFSKFTNCPQAERSRQAHDSLICIGGYRPSSLYHIPSETAAKEKSIAKWKTQV